MSIAIYIVDDHNIFREGISSLINLESDMEVIGKSGSVADFKKDIVNHIPDIILMDLTIGSEYGVDAINWLKAQKNEAKVLVLSMHRETEHVRNVIDAGANGFILKDASTEEMIGAIRTIYKGDSYYSQNIMMTIVTKLTKKNEVKHGLAGKKLTKRELEVLRLIAMEKSNQEIADALFISIRTVDTHRRNVMDKIDAKNTASLVKYAIKNGIIEI